ncbi:MAG: glycosyltransferase [Pirellulales bacterium]
MNAETRPTTNPPRLTAALIVRDAQASLPGTLEGVRGWADEIVVVDTGSADYTRDVARRYTPKVLGYRWDDDFSAARNAALAAAQGEWVLWLDAGETLAPREASFIRGWLEGQTTQDHVGLLFISVPPARPEGSVERVARARLQPRVPGLTFAGRVAESLAPAARRLGITEQLLDATLCRTAVEHVPETKRRRAQRNIRLAELEIADRGPSPRMSIVIGEARLDLGQFDQAAAAFRRALETSVRGSLDALWAYYGLLTTFESVPAAGEAQLATCLQALESFPFDAQLLCAMGNYLQLRDRFDLAARSFETAFRFGQVHPELWHLDDLTAVAGAARGLALQLAGQEAEAESALREAIESLPDDPRLRRRLGELYIQQGNQRAAVEQFGRLRLPATELDPLKSAVRGACLAAKQNWAAALSYLKAAFDEGCRDLVALRWYTLSLLATEAFATARQVLEAWKTIDPESGEAARFREFLERQGPALVLETDAEGRTLRVDPADTPPGAPLRGARAAKPEESSR